MRRSPREDKVPGLTPGFARCPFRWDDAPIQAPGILFAELLE
jgi:hypothetical protein